MTEQKYIPGKAGTVFKPETGKLYVFSSHGVSVMIGWPHPMAWRKTPDDARWVHFRPEITIPSTDLDGRIQRLKFPADKTGQVLMPFCLPPYVARANRTKLAWHMWCDNIPTEIREVVGRFPQCYRQMKSDPARRWDFDPRWGTIRPACGFGKGVRPAFVVDGARRVGRAWGGVEPAGP